MLTWHTQSPGLISSMAEGKGRKGKSKWRRDKWKGKEGIKEEKGRQDFKRALLGHICPLSDQGRSDCLFPGLAQSADETFADSELQQPCCRAKAWL